jgi:hypothetical protein
LGLLVNLVLIYSGPAIPFSMIAALFYIHDCRAQGSDFSTFNTCYCLTFDGSCPNGCEVISLWF